MSKRNSFSEKIGKYLGFFPAAYSLPNEEKRENDKDNNNNKNINNKNNKMAHPGLSNSNNQNKQNNYNYKNNNDVFDTKNFDKIDYIVQIPLIDNPNERQTRFLLAMDYTLPARDGLGIMDTALEHIVHYYDMNKVELIFCEMWQSVCLFIEFHDTTSCTNAYNQLFQFFKTIFYVENLSQLEELWICGHCKHYNQFDEYLRGLNSINDKRKTKKGDEYIYWCNRCKNVNHPSFKKIKYSYQSLPKPNKKRKSNRDQIGSVSFPCSKPKWVDAKSQPIANRALTMGAPQNNNVNNIVNIDNDADALRTVGCDILMGQARGSLKFNLPNNMKSKSMDCLQQQHNRNISGISSSPELISPTSSAGVSGVGMPSLYNHGKKSSLDSALSVTSTTSTVSSIDNNLDLCCSILQTIQQETETLSSHSGNTHHQNTSVTHQNLQQLQQQRNDVVQKIATLNNMLTNIQSAFTNAIENHKYCMHQSVQIFNKNSNECKIDHNNNGNVYKSHNNNKPTRGGPILTSQNLYDYNRQNQLLSDEDTSHSDHYNYNNYNYNQFKDDDELRTPAGTILMGQARGPIAFKLPPAHHSNSNHHKQ